MADTCATCRFWDAYERGSDRAAELGDCRFNPPRISERLLKQHAPHPLTIGDGLEDAIYEASAFAITHATSWCGRFEPAPDGEPRPC